MSNKGQHRDDPISRKRLAQLGLAVDSAGPEESCPDAERFAEMLDAEVGSAAHRAFLEHLSVCEPCLQKWLVLSDELDSRTQDRRGVSPWFKHRRLLTGVGSACGLALVAMLYLAIDYRPVLYDGADAQLSEKISSGSTIAEPDAQPQPAADSGADEQPENRQLSPSSESELALETVKKRQKAATPPRIEKKSTNVASAPASPDRVKEETTDGAADFLERDKSVLPGDSFDQGAAAPEMTTQSIKMAETMYRSVVGAADPHDVLQYSNFIDSVTDLCAMGSAGITADAVEPLLAQGRALLTPEALPTGERRIFVEEVVTFLEKEKPIDDKEWIEFCERVSMITEQELTGGTPQRELE